MQHTEITTAVQRQFGAAIEALGKAMQACPEELWKDRSRKPEFWYIAYHALFWLDLYLSDSPEGFAPPPPFTLSELDPDILPDRVYTKAELQKYLEHGSKKFLSVIQSRSLEEHRKFHSVEGTLLEVLLYNMRHVQHHAAQLNLILRQSVNNAPRWVRRKD